MRLSKLILLFLTCVFISAVCCSFNLYAQDSGSTTPQTDSVSVHKGRLTGVLSAQGILYVSSIAGLYFAWYKDYPQSRFHFFNDDNEWLQMDKIGHSTTAYYISQIGYVSYKWSGVERKKAILYGGLLGLAYLTNIEILDGFSSQWGFSIGDFTANAAGCLIFAGQQLAWDEQRFQLKYSFHQTSYPSYRRNLLGTNLPQQLVKDYNGQTYWLSCNIASFLPKGIKFPKWLNIAAGYGAEGMVGAKSNSTGDPDNKIPDFQRYRQYYLSLDVDLTRIPTRIKPLKALLTVFSFIKVPFPAIEFNSLDKIKFHYFYF
ncbi:MAG: DUF2279 domain-containing protein [Bacteroidetes bacterium]|nr:DUF2279 domain-containing protein [Bacteroidota bacterium]